VGVVLPEGRTPEGAEGRHIRGPRRSRDRPPARPRRWRSLPRKKPTWQHSLRSAATSAYSSRGLPPWAGCPALSHPTTSPPSYQPRCRKQGAGRAGSYQDLAARHPRTVVPLHPHWDAARPRAEEAV